MITAKVEISENSGILFFRSLQSSAIPMALINYVPEKQALITLKAEPSLMDVIFLVVDMETEEFFGYIWLKKQTKKFYKLIKHELNILDRQYDYEKNIFVKLICEGYDIKIDDFELFSRILSSDKINKNGELLISNETHFKSFEILYSFEQNNEYEKKYINWYFDNSQEFWPGRLYNNTME